MNILEAEIKWSYTPAICISLSPSLMS